MLKVAVQREKKARRAAEKSPIAICCALIFACLAIFNGCGRRTYGDFTLADFFGTDVYVRAEFSGGDERAFDEIKNAASAIAESYKSSFSSDNESSAVSRYNRALPDQTVELSEKEYLVINRAKELYTACEGAYNPSLYLLSDLWAFTPRFDGDYSPEKPYDRPRGDDGAFALPDDKYISAFLSLSDFSDTQAQYDGEKYFIVKSSASARIDGATYYRYIDLSGMIKGAAACEIFDCVSARFPDCYVNIGSSSITLGTRGGDNYTLGIVNPFLKTRVDFLGLSVKNKSVSTSGTYEKYYFSEGKYCHHILDPITGAPSDGGVVSATLIGADGALLDAFSTALCTMNIEGAVAFVNSLTDISAVLVCKFGDEQFFLTNIDQADYTLKGQIERKGSCENGKIIYE